MGIPKIVIAGTQSGVGKTTVSMGLMKCLVKRGMNLQPFKVGPDYIDPAFHTYVTGNSSRNLDSWMIDKKEIRYLFAKSSKGKDIAVVEGVMGLYDGFSTEKDNGSTAHVSKIIDAPVLLIINGNGMSSSAAAQVLGYAKYDEDVNIAGVIINKVSGQVHYDLLKEAIERDTEIKCYGYLKKNLNINLESRHLGLIPSGEVANLENKLNELADMIEETLDIDGIIDLADEYSENMEVKSDSVLSLGEVNIGVPMDSAFNFYYKDNLEYLEQLGAKLYYFSPLKDKDLPNNLDGIYIGGGFPEVFPGELSQNKEMLVKIKELSDRGMPIYAECGGLMYLCNSIIDLEDNEYPMVGIFDVSSKMTKRLQRFGYVNVNISTDNILGLNEEVRAHEFHRSLIEGSDERLYTYSVEKARKSAKIKHWQCGVFKNKTLGAYPHIHFYANRDIAKNYIKECIKYKDEVKNNG